MYRHARAVRGVSFVESPIRRTPKQAPKYPPLLLTAEAEQALRTWWQNANKNILTVKVTPAPITTSKASLDPAVKSKKADVQKLSEDISKSKSSPSTKESSLTKKITDKEKRKLGSDRPQEQEFLDSIQKVITDLTKSGIRSPKKQADHLNGIKLFPFAGLWTDALIIAFFKRRHELNKKSTSKSKKKKS